MKRIQAPTLTEALEKTRKECGEDALLVETRETSKGYLVVAARPPRPAAGKTDRDHEARRRWTPGFAPLAERARAFGIGPRVLEAVEKAMIGTRVRVDRAGDPALPGVAARILKALIRVESMPLPRYRVTTLVGPTGVGKTTTLAKLAARARQAGETVAILTADTYRVAAVEQLRAYAEMLAVPFEVAVDAIELRRAIERHAGVDRVFVDTSGKSPFDREAIEALRARLSLGRPACALCLAAGTRRADALAALRGFAPVGPDCIVLTKWDETRVPGEVMGVAIEQGLPLSHVTVGQEVPDDIVAADPGALAASAFALPEDQAEAVL